MSTDKVPMRFCFVPVTAGATEEIFRISIAAECLAGCCPATGSQSGQHREKKDIFLFIILHYPFWFGLARSTEAKAVSNRKLEKLSDNHHKAAVDRISLEE
ncbi:hypothetical protein QE152_g8843 [Popillia japonica]|uniref:Uncharacterized protein n=1 Tax=Popillia japonica TaxID=7064 RepID=A0AAW1M245_POPJA